MNRIRFTGRNKKGFYAELRTEVENYFEEQGKSRFANRFMFFKIVFYFALWIGSYLFLLTAHLDLFSQWLTAMFFGFVSLLLILNIGHDAVHNALSSRPLINKLLGYTFNLVGANAYSWYLKHNVSHHLYPNIQGADIDLETGPLLKISPYSEYRKYYKYQHLYAPFLYMLLSLLLIFVMDFMLLVRIRPLRKVTMVTEWIILLITKIFYVFYIIILPWKILHLSFEQVLFAFLTMHMLIGLIIALIFQPSHYVEGRLFEAAPQNSSLEKDWAIHQVETTIDISSKSRLANFFLGGLNTNTIHHLFPEICHVHFIDLSNILQRVARDYEVDYKEYTLPGAVAAHFEFLKQMGKEKYE